MVLVQPDDGNTFVARAPRETLSGQTAVVMVRPTGVRLCGADEDDHHLTGQVTDVAFRGRGYEHAINLGGGIQLTGVLADRRVARGETVGVRLDPAGCLVFPDVLAEPAPADIIEPAELANLNID
jgi:iron(III) transport system ATP-binding protein